MFNIPGQIIATSHDLTPKGSWEREIPLFQGNLGWWNIIIWPDIRLLSFIVSGCFKQHFWQWRCNFIPPRCGIVDSWFSGHSCHCRDWTHLPDTHTHTHTLSKWGHGPFHRYTGKLKLKFSQQWDLQHDLDGCCHVGNATPWSIFQVA